MIIDKKLLRNLDYVLLFAVYAIIFYSIIIISSATHVTGETGAGLGFVTKQLIAVILGTGVMFFILSYDYDELKKITKFLYGFTIVMLVAVEVMGKVKGGAQSWFNIGAFAIQPSEFAKFFLIISFAHFLSVRKEQLKTLWGMLPAFLYMGFPMALILIQPDLGTALVLAAIMFGMLFIAGGNPYWLLTIIIVGIVTVVGVMYAHVNYGLNIPLEEYQVKRLTIFLDPMQDPTGAGYHVIQSQIAIGSGGALGKGLFQGTQNQLNFLPEQHTDFIFSVVGEELGFAGAMVLLFLFLLLIYRGLRIAAASKDLFGTLIATGIVSMILFHILVNVGMTISIMPITGIPLPFFSYGGSALLTNMMSIGLVLNIYMRRQRLLF